MNGLKRIELRAYQNWIELNISVEEAIENCSTWVLVMKQAFPELEIVKGSVCHPYNERCYHEWMLTADGTVIDPTRMQFDSLFGDDWKYNLE